MDASLIIVVLVGVVVVWKLCMAKKNSDTVPGTTVREERTTRSSGCAYQSEFQKTDSTTETTIAIASRPARSFIITADAASLFDEHGLDSGDSWLTDPMYWWMSGNIYYSSHELMDGLFDSTDAINDMEGLASPVYAEEPGNIHHDDCLGINNNCTTCSPDPTDWITDPSCSFMPGNLFHDDDALNSTTFSSDDDTWASTTSEDDSTFSTTSSMDDVDFSTVSNSDDDW